jgi:hypothetical protein
MYRHKPHWLLFLLMILMAIVVYFCEPLMANVPHDGNADQGVPMIDCSNPVFADCVPCRRGK